MISFHIEGIENCVSEIIPLTRKHHEEVSSHKPPALNPNFELYAQAEKAGMFLLFTARNESNMVGYAAYFIASSQHYKDSKQAHQDVIYMEPHCRGHAMSFIQFCDDELKRRKVEIVRCSMKTKKDFSPLMFRMGYQLEEYVYTRRLN